MIWINDNGHRLLGRIFVVLFVPMLVITLIHTLPLAQILLHVAVTEDMLRAEALWKFRASDRAIKIN